MLNKILVPSDLSTESNSILPYALTLGQAFQSKVYLLHVVDRLDPRKAALVPAFPHIRSFLKRDRQAAGGRTLPAEIPVGRVHLYQDDPESSILDYAAKKKVDLICLAATTDNRRLAWWSAGEITESLIKRAGCSVFCLRGRPIPTPQWRRPRFKNILLLLDLDDQGAAPLMKAVSLAETFHSLLHVFPVMRRQTGKRAEHPLARLARDHAGQTNVLLFADPQRSLRNLLEFVRHTEIDLIILPAKLRPRVSTWLLNDVLVQLMKITDSPIWMLR